MYLLLFRGPSWRNGTRCDCKTDWLWVRSPLEEMKYLLKFIFPFLRFGFEYKCGVESATQHAMPSEFGRKWGTECHNTSFPLATLQCAGYSVKLIYIVVKIMFYKLICIYILSTVPKMQKPHKTLGKSTISIVFSHSKSKIRYKLFSSYPVIASVRFHAFIANCSFQRSGSS